MTFSFEKKFFLGWSSRGVGVRKYMKSLTIEAIIKEQIPLFMLEPWKPFLKNRKQIPCM